MIRFTEIQDKLLHLIGWEQSYSTSHIKVAEHLTTSESGFYFQYVHPLLTLDNLMSIAPDFANVDIPDYDSARVYKKGELVKKGETIYRAGIGNLQNTEPGASENWVETNLFSEWLEAKTKGSIHKAISRYCNERLASGTMKSICENKVLFDGTGRLVDTIKNKNNFVGFELVPIRSRGITLVINKIGLQFTKPGAYSLYLFHSSSATPIDIVTVEKKRENVFEWFTVNLTLPYLSDKTDAGGSWYLGYFQEDLPVDSQAIEKNKDWSKQPCAACSRVEYASWQAWSKYLEVHPFKVQSSVVPRISGFSSEFSLDFQSADTLWDVSLNQYNYTTNFGLNLEVSVHCDITDFIIEQRQSFVDIISKQLAVDMLREFAYNANSRANRHALNASRSDILYELEGDTSAFRRTGLSYQLDLAMDALKLSLQGLDRVCLPCKNNGIKYKTI